MYRQGNIHLDMEQFKQVMESIGVTQAERVESYFKWLDHDHDNVIGMECMKLPQ
jgi:Ca2+-binding EF-hand superfamily protein